MDWGCGRQSFVRPIRTQTGLELVVRQTFPIPGPTSVVGLMALVLKRDSPMALVTPEHSSTSLYGGWGGCREIRGNG